MQSLKMIVAGLGSLGSEVCRRLAETPSPHVLMIDPQRMQARNALRSLVYQDALTKRPDDYFGTWKVDLVADFIKENFALSWERAAIEIADAGLERMAKYDIILSCTDNALARVEASRAARVLGLPMIDAGVMGDGVAQGRVTFFPANHKAACYLCGMTEARRAEILAYAASASLGCRALEEAPSMTGTLETVRATAEALSTLVQEWQAGELLADQAFARRVRSSETGQWCTEPIALARSITCPWHVEVDEQWCALEEDRPIREALTGHDLRVQLLWPHCLQARCRQCGHITEPLRRVAWVRRTMECAACGASGTTEPLHAIEAIGAMDREADCTPRQLGLPNRHLYLLRRAFTPRSQEGSR